MEISEKIRPSFQVNHESEPSESLIAGFSAFGMAGLTAVDYLTDQLGLTETGHITADELPAITPFESGTPRHHTRLFSRSDVEVTVLENELFVPLWAADSFSRAILNWADENGVEEITVLSGIPLPHGPDEHRPFYIATEDYQAARLQEAELTPMGSGFLDGVNASLVGRGIDTDLRVGVFVTPVHAQTPDVEAALRLIDAVEAVLDLDVDTGTLEKFAGEVEQHYQELAERLQRIEPEQTSEDRMYM